MLLKLYIYIKQWQLHFKFSNFSLLSAVLPIERHICLNFIYMRLAERDKFVTNKSNSSCNNV